jgi:hypothetical protein
MESRLRRQASLRTKIRAELENSAAVVETSVTGLGLSIPHFSV